MGLPFGAVDLVAARDAQWLVLFDLDIYEPTAFAWEVISAHLRAGDVMYLDEAFDGDERRVLDEMRMRACRHHGARTGFDCKYLVFVLPVAALVARDPDGPPGSGIFDRVAALGDRRRAVCICVSLAAARTIAQIVLPGSPVRVVNATPVVASTVLAPILWLVACAAIIVSYARRPACCV